MNRRRFFAVLWGLLPVGLLRATSLVPPDLTHGASEGSLGRCDICDRPATTWVADDQELLPVRGEDGTWYERGKAIHGRSRCNRHYEPSKFFPIPPEMKDAYIQVIGRFRRGVA